MIDLVESLAPVVAQSPASVTQTPRSSLPEALRATTSYGSPR